MSFEIFNSISNFVNLKNDSFSSAHEKFRKTMVEDFLNDVISTEKYHVKASVGMGTMSNNWWVTICDVPFYKKMYDIDDGRKISASIGYYVAYLFNEDNSKVYLCINQASDGINKSSNIEFKEYRRRINRYLLEQIEYPSGYLNDIHGMLTTNRKNNRGMDYEEGTFLAICYDLRGKAITDSVFINDIHSMLSIYSKLVKILLKKTCLVEGNIYDFRNRVILQNDIPKVVMNLSSISNFDEETNEDHVVNNMIQNELQDGLLDKDELQSLNKRKPEFYEKNGTSRLITNPRLIVHALVKSEHVCQACGKKKTFINTKGVNYMEGHHLVPVSFQNKFNFDDYNLDNSDNIVCLCPECHRAIHYGSEESVLERVLPLYEKMDIKFALEKKGIAKDVNEFLRLFFSGK